MNFKHEWDEVRVTAEAGAAVNQRDGAGETIGEALAARTLSGPQGQYSPMDSRDDQEKVPRLQEVRN